MAAEVRAICIKDNMPSCIRAPPEAAKQIKGCLSAMAFSAACTKRSPTTVPIEPPMKSNSKAQAIKGIPLSKPCITTKASVSPVLVCASLIRAGYGFESTNFNGSLALNSCPNSVCTWSKNQFKRSRAFIRKCSSH